MHEVVRVQPDSSPSLLPVPAPGSLAQPIAVRTATAADFEWIDARQKAESDKLGFLPATAIQKRIEQGNVLEAEAPSLAERKRAAKAAAKAARRKSDPRLLAFSRELRDRWGEAVAERPGLIGLGCEPKYELGRQVEGDFPVGDHFALLPPGDVPAPTPLLDNDSDAGREAA